jgi:hypothetical protein
VIGDARNPRPSIGRGWKIRENEGIFDRNLLLVVIPVSNPSANLLGIQRARDEPLMKGMLVVVAFRADGLEPRDEVTASLRRQKRA